MAALAAYRESEGFAMSENGIPAAVWSGTFTVFGVELKCHVLETGERIIEAESLNRFLAAFGDGTIDPNRDDPDEERFYRWMQGALVE